MAVEQYRKDRTVITRDLVTVYKRGERFTYGTMPRVNAEHAIALRDRPGVTWDLQPTPSCRCCGEPAWQNLRCTKHQDRNPCAVEGCQRTTKAGGAVGYREDQWLCSEHWRRYVPPGSRSRKAYNAHFRRGRRQGWPRHRIDAFHRFWDLLIAQVRRASTEGALDETEINRMFGW